MKSSYANPCRIKEKYDKQLNSLYKKRDSLFDKAVKAKTKNNESAYRKNYEAASKLMKDKIDPLFEKWKKVADKCKI